MKVETVLESILFSTVRIETTSNAGSASGTGFIFSYPSPTGVDEKFLVTNKHVVAKAITGHLFFTQANGATIGFEEPLLGQRADVTIDNFESIWLGHPDPRIDVAACKFEPIIQALNHHGKRIFFKSVPHKAIPSKVEIEEFDALEEVVFFGYPDGLYDNVSLLPIIRRGITATPAQIDFNGSPMFLIDASVFPGSSGSPVFLLHRPGRTDSKGSILYSGPNAYLLGILSAVHVSEDLVPVELIPVSTGRIPGVKTTQMLDLGIVYKASTVLEVVTHGLSPTAVINNP